MEIDVNTVLCMQDLRTLIRYYFDIKIYIWEHLEIKVGIKIIQYVCICYITLLPPLRGLYLDWKIEDSDGS